MLLKSTAGAKPRSRPHAAAHVLAGRICSLGQAAAGRGRESIAALYSEAATKFHAVASRQSEALVQSSRGLTRVWMTCVRAMPGAVVRVVGREM